MMMTTPLILLLGYLKFLDIIKIINYFLKVLRIMLNNLELFRAIPEDQFFIFSFNQILQG
jgi:hypothetical protein